MSVQKSDVKKRLTIFDREKNVYQLTISVITKMYKLILPFI